MADNNLDLQLKISAENQASPELASLMREVAQLRAELDALKAKNQELNDSKPGFWSNTIDWALKLINTLSLATLATADFGKMSDEEFLKYAETQIKTAEATGKLVDASIQQEAANRKLSSSYNDLVNSITKGNIVFDTLLKKVGDSTRTYEQFSASQESGIAATNAYHQVQQAQLSIFGSTKDAIESVISVQSQAIDTAQQEAQIKRTIADNELANLNKLKAEQAIIFEQEYKKQQQSIISQTLAKIGLVQIDNEAEKTKGLSNEQKQQLETLRQSAIQKNDAAKIAEYHAQQLKVEANSTQSVVTQINALVASAQRNSDVQINEIENEKALIEAKKEEATERLKVLASQREAIEVDKEDTDQQKNKANLSTKIAETTKNVSDAIEAKTAATKEDLNAEKEDDDEEEKSQVLDEKSIALDEQKTESTKNITTVVKEKIDSSQKETEESAKAALQKQIENEIEQHSNDLAQVEIKLADQKADKARAASDAARSYAQALQAQVDANDLATAADQHAADVAKTVADSLEKQSLALFRASQAVRDKADIGDEASKRELAAANKAVIAAESQQKALEQQNTIALKTTDIQLQLAEVEGRYADAVRLSKEQEELRAKGAQARVTQINSEIEAQKTLVDKLENYHTVVDGKVIPADEAIIAAAKEKLLAMQAELQQAQLTLNKTAEIVAARAKEIELTKAVAAAAMELAKSKGDENEVAKQSLIISQQDTATSQILVTNKQVELDAAKALFAEKMKENEGRILTIDEYNREILASKNSVVQKQLEAQQAEKDLELKQRLQRQAEIMAGPVGELTRLYAEQTKEHQRAADASTRYHNAQVQEAEDELKLAQIKGDVAGQDAAQIKITDRKIEQAQSLAATMAQEAKDTENAVSAKVMAMAADGNWSKADQEVENQLRATAAAQNDAALAAQANADQLVKEAAASKEAADAAKKLAEAEQEAKAATDQLAAAGDAVNSNWAAVNKELTATGGNAAELQKAFIKLQEEFTRTGNALSADKWVAWAAGTAAAADKVVASFHAQKDTVDQAAAALDAYAKTGEFTAQTQQALNKETDLTRGEFALLNDADLSRLQSSIDTAKGKMEALRQASEDALAAAQQALLQEQGDTVGVLRLQQKKDELDLQNKINEAKAAGDQQALANLQTTLALEQQTYEIKLKKAANDTNSTDQAVSDAHKVRDAWGSVETAITSTNSALKGLASVDLSKVVSHSESIKNNFSALAGMI